MTEDLGVMNLSDSDNVEMARIIIINIHDDSDSSRRVVIPENELFTHLSFVIGMRLIDYIFFNVTNIQTINVYKPTKEIEIQFRDDHSVLIKDGLAVMTLENLVNNFNIDSEENE